MLVLHIVVSAASFVELFDWKLVVLRGKFELFFLYSSKSKPLATCYSYEFLPLAN